MTTGAQRCVTPECRQDNGLDYFGARKVETELSWQMPDAGNSALGEGSYVNLGTAARDLGRAAAVTVGDGVNTAAQRKFVYNAAGDVIEEQVLDRRAGVEGDAWRSRWYGRDARGRITSVRDADQVTATYGYGNCAGAGLSSRTTAAGTTLYEMECNLGLVTKTTDANGRVDEYRFDVLGRMREHNEGGVRVTRWDYGDTGGWVVERGQVDAAGSYAATVVYRDTAGRARRRRVLETAVGEGDAAAISAANESGSGIAVETRSSTSAGKRAEKVSNPMRVQAATTDGWTVTLRDQAGRVCAVEHYEGASEPAGGTCAVAGTDHRGRTAWSYSWPVNQSVKGQRVEERVSGTPEQVRRRVTDGLGRLVQVVEDPAGKNELTGYTYDAADRLRTVTQAARQREFRYWTAGWLLAAANPENGETTYEYTAGGRLLWRQDARTARSTFSYDGAGRVLSKTYTGNDTPAVSYGYEGDRLKSVTNSVAAVSYEHDGIGRVTLRTQRMVQGQTYTY